ncbi:hypothetical protein Hanom_Chr16g01468851 [Helianthus anomalus]
MTRSCQNGAIVGELVRLVHVLNTPSFNIDRVDDDPCESCESGEHLLEDCFVFYENVQTYKDREDSLSGWYEYERTDYEDLNGPTSYYPYVNPPPPPSYQEYYYSEIDYHYEKERGYKNYEPELPHFSSYWEEYDDYYNEYPQPASEEPQDSISSKLDAIMNAIIISNQEIKMELKKELEVSDKKPWQRKWVNSPKNWLNLDETKRCWLMVQLLMVMSWRRL